ncbi:MAG: hypothetical protein IPN74_13170 [Haliscomenobacter sp.]|nr:hypothetical protein [Haliscomenobacter sp.]
MFDQKSSEGGGSPRNTFWALILFVGLLVGVFFMARLVFRLLYFLGPVILIAALILDHKVFLDYISWLRKIFKRDTLMGVAAIVLSVLGYPIVSAILLGRALMRRQVKTLQRDQERRAKGELTDFEELESRQFPTIPPLFREEKKEREGDDLV